MSASWSTSVTSRTTLSGRPSTCRRRRRFDFARFYDGLALRGFLIYPGKLTRAESFRIGCIGRIDEAVMRRVVAAVAEVTGEMGFDPAAGSRRA